MNSAISLKNVTKRYDKFVLDNITLDIPKGCITGLVGENGAGKTTLLKLILGFLSPCNGELLIDGIPFHDMKSEWKNDVGVVITGLEFAAMMNAKEFGRAMRYSFSRWKQDAYEGYLKTFKIDEKKCLKEYSKGMLMKLAIAAALSHDAKLLILDEPTSGLDPIVRDEILDILLDFIQDEEHSVLLSSHITSDLEKVADYIAFLHEGKLKFFMNKDELLYDYGIIRCREEELQDLPADGIVAVRKGCFQCEVLVRGKQKFQKEQFVLDDTTIEEIILFMVKGEAV